MTHIAFKYNDEIFGNINIEYRSFEYIALIVSIPQVRLETWQERGRRQLEEMLAKMGFRLRDTKLAWGAHRLRTSNQPVCGWKM